MDSNFLQPLKQVRRQVIELCEAKRFTAANMFLIGSGCPPKEFPGLWEYLARQSAGSGNDVVAHKTRSALWEAGVKSQDTTLREAEYFLAQGDEASAIYILKSFFGTTPANHRALHLLARGYLRQAEVGRHRNRMRTQSSLATELDELFTAQTPQEAMTVIDLLRFSGALELASKRNMEASRTYPDHSAFRLRAARILEQQRDPAAAIEIWQSVSEESLPHRTEALFKLHQLHLQLGNDAAANKAAGHLAASNLSMPDRLRLAIAIGQRQMIAALSENVIRNAVSGTLPNHDDARRFTDLLMQAGEIGLAVHLRRNRVPVSDATKSDLDGIGFGANPTRPLPDTIEEALALRSPDFLLPLSTVFRRTARPAGWPGQRRDVGRVLLINGTMGQGGAERQFVELVRAHLQNGIPKEALHCGFFSLEADRGFDRFLPELRALGVTVHDMNANAEVQKSLPGDIAAAINVMPFELGQDVRALWHLVAEVAPDTLHGWQDRSGLAAGLVGHLADLERVIMSNRNMAPDTRKDQRLMGYLPLYQDFLAHDNYTMTVNSKAGAKDYARWIGCAESRVQLLTNTVNLDVFNPDALGRTKTRQKSAPVRLGGLFRMAANKQPFFWLEIAAALVRHHGLSIVPVLRGAGPLTQEVKEKARELGFEDVDIQGDLSTPSDLYGDLDVVLLTSRTEGMPNVLIEAQACGLPVVATDVGGSAEAFLRQGVGAGLLLGSADTAEQAAKRIADWLPQALADPPSRRVAFAKRRFGGPAFSGDAKALYLGQVRADA